MIVQEYLVESLAKFGKVSCLNISRSIVLRMGTLNKTHFKNMKIIKIIQPKIRVSRVILEVATRKAPVNGQLYGCKVFCTNLLIYSLTAISKPLRFV